MNLRIKNKKLKEKLKFYKVKPAKFHLIRQKEFTYLREYIKKTNVPFVKDGLNGYGMHICLIIDHENMD